MARRFQGRGRFQNQGQRRVSDWIGGNQVTLTDEVNLAGGTSVIALAFDTRAVATPSAPFTIVRVRGEFNIFSNVVAVTKFATGAVGIAIVNGEAFDAGVGSLITPWSESFDDRWLYHSYWSINQAFVATETTQQNNAKVVIDSKSKRKVETGDVIVTVIENASSDSITFFINQRILVLVA